jgi:hypothetical protein
VATQVIHIDAYPSPPLVPRKPGNYHRDLLDKPHRPAPKPLHVVQPQVRTAGTALGASGAALCGEGWESEVGQGPQQPAGWSS